MKIAFFVHGYLPWDVYGVPRYVQNLSDYLVTEGHQVTIFCAWRQGLPKVEEPKPNIMIFRTSFLPIPQNYIFPYKSLLSYTLGCCFEALNVIKRRNIELIHGFTIRYGGLQAAIVAQLTQLPFVVSNHASYVPSFSKWESFVLRRSDAIICNYPPVEQELVEIGIPRYRIFDIPTFIDTTNYSQAKHKKSITKTILFIGRLTAFKGPSILLKAIPEVLKKFPNAQFFFVGDGDQREVLGDIVIELDLQRNVRFMGQQKDITKYLLNSDIFVACSPVENYLSISLCEAMASGLAIVATDVGYTSTVIKDGEMGILCKPTPEDISEKIVFLLENDELRASLGMNAKIFASKNLDKKINSAKIVKIYENIIKTSGKYHKV